MAGGKTAILAIRIISDAKNAQQGLNDTANAAGRFERSMNTARTAATAVVGGLVLIGKEAFDSASRLQQAAGAVESVYGAQEAAVDRLAAGAADRLGLASSEYSEFASVLGAQLKNLGIPHDELVDQQEALQQKGADLAATFGGTTADAIAALGSLMRGERDPIERYGVTINQAGIDAYLAAKGLSELEGQERKNAETQATLALLTEQTASATGAFAREADTAAGAQQRATANFENAKAALGEALLPAVSAVATKLSELAVFAQENSTAFLIVAGVLGGLAIAVFAVNAALSAYRAIAAVATAAQWLWNAALLANPLTWVVIAIVAVVAAVVLMYQKFEWFRNFAQAVGGVLGGIFDGLRSALGWVIDKIQWVLDKAGAVGAFIGRLNPFDSPAPSPATPTLAAGRYAAVGAGELSAAGNLRAGSMLAGATPVGAPSSSSMPASSGPAVVIHVNGAIDPLSTARQIRRLLLDDDRLAGRGVALSVSAR